MISRGYFIGAIVDEFSTIAEKISMRNRLGMTDLSTHAEDYFRNVLNRIYGWNMQTLNKTRPNEPDLDLGDAASRVGIQITSDASSAKVKATLAAISDDLHAYVNKEAARLRVELEVPDADGNFPTTSYNQWEPVAIPASGNGDAFVRFIMESYNDGLEEKDQGEIRDSIVVLVEKLRRLPRITREFLAVLIERREEGGGRRNPNASMPRVLLPKLERVYLGGDLKGELQLLDDARLVSIKGESEHEYGPAEVYISLSRNEDLRSSFVEFIDKSNLDVRQVIGKVDFSAF